MLWTDFINSYARDWRSGDEGKAKDWLTDDQWVPAWLKEYDLPPLTAPTGETLAELRSLRSALFGMVQDLADGRSLAPEQRQRLNAAMARGPVVRELEEAEGEPALALRPLGTDWAQVQAEIAASLAKTLAERDTTRIRVCENPDCLWVYYDDTRNRSKRYCEDKTCGNLLKVRRFRARKKAEKAQKTVGSEPSDE